jgi:hypothetical protein
MRRARQARVGSLCLISRTITAAAWAPSETPLIELPEQPPQRLAGHPARNPASDLRPTRPFLTALISPISRAHV